MKIFKVGLVARGSTGPLRTYIFNTYLQVYIGEKG